MRAVEGFLVSVTDGKPARMDAPRLAEALRAVQGADLAWMNFEVDDLAADALHIGSILGFSGTLIENLAREQLAEYDDRDTELGMRVPLVRVHGLEVDVEPLLVLVRENFVLTLYQKGTATRFRKFARYAETAMRKIPRDVPLPDRITLLMMRLLNENNERNFDGIRSLEEHGERIAAQLVQEDADRRAIAGRIYEMKRALIQYLDALWASLDVIHNLRHGDAELISDDDAILARMTLLGDDVQRHIQLSEHMSEVLASGLEVMQSIYNNQLQLLNNRMAFIVAWLTVLGTAVLVPNTLATILSAAPPELQIRDPYLFLLVMVGSTLAATLAAWFWVKRRVPVKVE